MIRQPFTFHAIMQKAVDDEGNNIVKGFASMNNADRSQDLIAPESFLLDRFMVNPQLQRNHKKWIDENGNDVNIGLVTQASVAKIVDIDSDDVWGISLEDGSPIDTFSKEISPDVVVGSRGLWVKAQVTIPEVWKEVENGTLNTFSWRGLASIAKVVIGGVEKFVTKTIDLWECSLVHIPDNFASTFEIAKGVQFGSDLMKYEKQTSIDLLSIHQIRFSPTIFEQATAKTWLADHSFSSSVAVDKTGGELVHTNLKKECFDEECPLLSMQMATGVQLIVGKEITDGMMKSHGEFSERIKFLQDLEMLEQRSQEMANKKTKDGQESSVTVKEAVTTPETKSAETETEATPAKETAAKKETKTSPETKDAEKPKKEPIEESEKKEAEGSAEKTDDVPAKEPVAKGVTEQLDIMNSTKWSRVAEIFKSFSAFEEAVWDAPNEVPDLQNLVKELCVILTTEQAQIKAADHQTVLTEMGKTVAAQVLDAIKPEIAKMANSAGLMDESLTLKKEDALLEEKPSAPAPSGQTLPANTGGRDSNTTAMKEAGETPEVISKETDTKLKTETKTEPIPEPETKSVDAKKEVTEDVPATELVKSLGTPAGQEHGAFLGALTTLSKGLQDVTEEMQEMKKTVVGDDAREEDNTPPVVSKSKNDVFSDTWPF